MYHSDKDAGDLRAYLSGDLPGRPENELVGVVLRLCEIVDELASERERQQLLALWSESR